MARRHQKEVMSRLTQLLTHLLEWEHQPKRRTRSWRGTILAQQQELRDDASTGVFRNHAEAVLFDRYEDAVARAGAETGLSTTIFPTVCPYTVEQLLSGSLPADR
jgi:hypothetical protein